MKRVVKASNNFTTDRAFDLWTIIVDGGGGSDFEVAELLLNEVDPSITVPLLEKLAVEVGADPDSEPWR